MEAKLLYVSTMALVVIMVILSFSASRECNKNSLLAPMWISVGICVIACVVMIAMIKGLI